MGPPETELVEPLLSTFEMTGSVEWPDESAQLVKLNAPVGWKGVQGTLRIRWDVTASCFQVVGESGGVVDVMYPQDIIGVAVDIKTYSAETDLDNLGFKNTENGNDNNNIFQAFADDSDRIFSVESDTVAASSQVMAVLSVYCYPKTVASSSPFCSSNHKGPTPDYQPDKCTGPRAPHHRKFQVLANDDFGPLVAVVKAMRSLAELRYVPQPYLVVVNPKSGTGKSRSVVDSHVVPMLQEEAGMILDIYETTHAHHGVELMRDQLNPSDYAGVISVGGDGLINELLQGIKARPDCDQILSSLRLGVLGCGSGNGLAYSVTHQTQEKFAYLESTFIIAKGKTVGKDLSVYQTTNQSYLSILTFSWAIIAEIDIESEFLRFLGAARFDVWAVWRVLTQRKYRAKFSYLPKPESGGEIAMPLLDQPVSTSDGWKVIEDEFHLFWASHVTHASSTTFNSPDSEMADGVFRILVVR